MSTLCPRRGIARGSRGDCVHPRRRTNRVRVRAEQRLRIIARAEDPQARPGRAIVDPNPHFASVNCDRWSIDCIRQLPGRRFRRQPFSIRRCLFGLAIRTVGPANTSCAISAPSRTVAIANGTAREMPPRSYVRNGAAVTRRSSRTKTTPPHPEPYGISPSSSAVE